MDKDKLLKMARKTIISIDLTGIDEPPKPSLQTDSFHNTENPRHKEHPDISSSSFTEYSIRSRQKFVPRTVDSRSSVTFGPLPPRISPASLKTSRPPTKNDMKAAPINKRLPDILTSEDTYKLADDTTCGNGDNMQRLVEIVDKIHQVRIILPSPVSHANAEIFSGHTWKNLERFRRRSGRHPMRTRYSSC